MALSIEMSGIIDSDSDTFAAMHSHYTTPLGWECDTVLMPLIISQSGGCKIEVGRWSQVAACGALACGAV